MAGLPALKPIGPQAIDWVHPLALGMTDCLLWNEGGGVPVNLAAPQIISTVTLTPAWTIGPAGLAGYSTGGSSFNIPDHGNFAAADFSIRILFRPVTWGATGFATLVNKGGLADREIGVFCDASGNVSYTALGDNVGFNVGTAATAMTAGSVWDFVLTRLGSDATFYVNGNNIQVRNPAGGTFAVAVPFNFAVSTTAGVDNADAQYFTAQVWKRALSGAEVRQLYVDPYCFLATPEGQLPAFVAVLLLYLRPDADSSGGSWINELGGTALFSSIDETVASDTDYIQSGVNPTLDVAKISLSNPSASAGGPVTLRYRYKKSDGPAADLTVRLLQGVSEIASWAHTGISTSFVTTEQTLTAPQLASISDFNDLYVEFTAD